LGSIFGPNENAIPSFRNYHAGGPPTRFGIYLNQFCQEGRPVADDIVEQARLAEEGGFDWVVLGDRRAWEPGFHEALTTLTWLAAHTDRIGLATAGLILPIYPPVLLAESLANVDVLSGGRLTAGFVLGYRPEEFAAHETARSHRTGLFEEGLEIVKRLWTSGRVGFTGRHHRLDDVRIAPLPLQRPRPPIWGAGRVETAIRRTARLCDGWTSSFNEEPEELIEKIRIYRDAPGSDDVQGKSVVVCRDAFCASDPDEARRLYERPIVELFRAYAGWKRTSDDAGRYRDLRWEALAGRLLVGGPDDLIEGTRRYAEMGADALILRLQPPGLPHADAMRAIELLSERVLPAFRVGTERA
jgi:alkanesulfonate monooxygenase SsuD/methylene tetrahydromethanopterin reductase-like flavin-dependent oxidoreductase (luciferase family)